MIDIVLMTFALLALFFGGLTYILHRAYEYDKSRICHYLYLIFLLLSCVCLIFMTVHR